MGLVFFLLKFMGTVVKKSETGSIDDWRVDIKAQVLLIFEFHNSGNPLVRLIDE